MSDRLAGKVALITGTAGGQGRAAAQLFAAEGAIVVGCDVKEDDAHETVRLVKDAGGTMISTAPVDLGDPEQATQWINEAAAAYGGFDILYNNASAARFGSIATMSNEDWRFTIRNELDLIFYACRAAWPVLVARGGGSIINTGSTCGVSGVSQVPGSLAHAATKGAVIALTRELALEGGPHGIRANSLSPGIVASPSTAPYLEVASNRDAHLAASMIRRIGEPEDIATAALFLASDESSWVTGANLMVDGGYSAWNNGRDDGGPNR
jgi:meso-butanediol dehydrogenase/(S,S)-butanediol dehydrogenase/diacetyl reductase